MAPIQILTTNLLYDFSQLPIPTDDVESEALAMSLRDIAKRAGGHATLFRSADKSAGVFAPLASPLDRIHRELKRSFDPHGLFNPGRLYPGL